MSSNCLTSKKTLVKNEGDTVRLRVVATRPDGKSRTIEAKLVVLDSDVKNRLADEAKDGDELIVTTRTAPAGSTCAMELVDFKAA